MQTAELTLSNNQVIHHEEVFIFLTNEFF